MSLLSPLLRPNLINLKLAFDPVTQIVQGTTDLASGKWTDWSFIEPGVPIPIAEETARFIRIRPK